eukprot:gene35110-43289_t
MALIPSVNPTRPSSAESAPPNKKLISPMYLRPRFDSKVPVPQKVTRITAHHVYLDTVALLDILNQLFGVVMVRSSVLQSIQSMFCTAPINFAT